MLDRILNVVKVLIGDQLGGGGTIPHVTGAVTGVIYKHIVFNEDTVFSAMVDNEGNDLVATQGVDTITWAKGLLFTPKGSKDIRIVSFTTVSGSVVGIV